MGFDGITALAGSHAYEQRCTKTWGTQNGASAGLIFGLIGLLWMDEAQIAWTT